MAEPLARHPEDGENNVLGTFVQLFNRLESYYPMQRAVILSGEGQGSRPDSYFIVDISFRDKVFALGHHLLSLEAIRNELKSSGFGNLALLIALRDHNEIDASNLSPKDLATLLVRCNRDRLTPLLAAFTRKSGKSAIKVFL